MRNFFTATMLLVSLTGIAKAGILVEDNFNSYSNGSILGQGNWTNYVNGNHFAVQDSTAFDGSKALLNNSLGDGVVTKMGTATTDGKQSVWVFSENRQQWGTSIDGNAQVRISQGSWASGTDIFATASFKSDGNVAFYDVLGKTYQNFATYNDNEWTLLEIEWRSTDKTARYGINGTTWTDWKVFSGSSSFTTFDNVGLGFNLPGGSGGVYFDTLGSTPTPEPSSIALLIVGLMGFILWHRR